MLAEFVSVVSPGAYTVSGLTGDIDGAAGQGVFYRDVRHLSGLWLRFNGMAPIPLACWVRGSEAEFALAAGVGPEGIEVLRRRIIGEEMTEEISLFNDAAEAIELRVELECAADFRDVFEVRGYRRAAERGEVSAEVGRGELRFAYRRDGFRRASVVRVSGEEIRAIAEPGRLTFGVHLGSHERRIVRVSVTLEDGSQRAYAHREAGVDPARRLYADALELESGWETLRRSWEKSVEDLEALSFDAGEGLLVPAAGAPWYMALFGRDALITTYQTMILSPDPARNILRALARYQAAEWDDFRDAEPGKVMHELRRGELAYFGEIPQTPYYGSADATPLFLVLLDEVWRWTGDDEFVREMEGHARRALGWVLDHADRIDGYVAYASRSSSGLRNQGWKDSAESMRYRDGAIAGGRVAPCEVQGYVYDAFVRTAELAERVWEDAGLAGELRAEAGALGERFERDFWMEDRCCYALALDAEGRKVDSVTSNAGHLLWSGIVSEERARDVAGRLLDEDMFSGWGIRTMAAGEGGYDPVSYHNGSVWPHDNSLIVCGLWRYGLRGAANRVAAALLDAAPCFDYRLPEVFAGYTREEAGEPVGMPESCSPQAWAAGTVPLLVRAMLGADPDPVARRLLADPVLPEGAGDLRLEDVPAFGERHVLG